MMRPPGPAPRAKIGGMNDTEPRGGMPANGLMGTFKEGGTVPATGHYKLHAGEKVLTSAQKDQMKNAFGLASATLSHDKAPEPEHKPMKKKLKSVKMHRAKNGGYIMKHEHHPPHHMMDDEHVAANKEGMLKHMAAEQNQPEAPPEPEEMGESAGTQQMESAIGMK